MIFNLLSVNKPEGSITFFDEIGSEIMLLLKCSFSENYLIFRDYIGKVRSQFICFNIL